MSDDTQMLLLEQKALRDQYRATPTEKIAQRLEELYAILKARGYER